MNLTSLTLLKDNILDLIMNKAEYKQETVSHKFKNKTEESAYFLK
jgi:hypothetical protein